MRQSFVRKQLHDRFYDSRFAGAPFSCNELMELACCSLILLHAV
jgi:hypothetical protein